ncbi:MAG: 2-hydroxyhepta-2,4-diene-1,7-dioate isomerase [Bacteroidetes bacterium]|jgi:2-keto-4-pentenoate hydratase/2-oxohepta-3-ene-1,7-dioic acid hydratase in catechol pathway|nr:2-hydroxyhepta-2,4-diene-1,7-dioate isomerase [Bacteroidota bacterium]
MKIICIGRNYAEHARELNNPLPAKPLFFLKPDSALLTNNNPFYIPDFSHDVHHELEIVIKINRLGKHINQKFAHRYYSEIGLGIDFTARDIQQECKQNGWPWEIAKSFDGSAPLGDFVPKENLDLKNLNFRLDINQKTRQQGNTSDLIFHFDELIAYISRFLTLKIGDLIFTGTPEGVGPVKLNDHLEGYLEEKKLLDLKVK